MFKNRIIKELPRALFFGFLIFGFLLIMQIINNQDINLNKNLFKNFGYTMLFTLSLHIANTILFIWLDKKFISDRFSKKRIITGFVLSFILSVFVIFLDRIIIVVLFENKSLIRFLKEESPKDYVLSLIFTFIILLIIHLIYLFKWYQENKVIEQKVIAGNVSAQFESLKSQIDPHFLFNSLNVLSSLIEENPEKAQKFTTSLSKIYRYVLEQRDKELVTVNEELEFAKTYINLLYMRFEDSIVCNLPNLNQYENDSDLKVVPLSLQLLLENTIKHNIANEKKQLKIDIAIENNALTIKK